MCFHGSGRATESVALVGCSASNCADSAKPSLDRFYYELVARFEHHANLLLWLWNTDAGAGLHTLHTRSLGRNEMDPPPVRIGCNEPE